MDSGERFVSIKTRIMLSTLIPVVMSFVLICVLNFTSLSASLHDTAEAELAQISQRIAAGFEIKLHNAMDYLSTVSSMLEMQAETGAADRELLQKKLFVIFDDYGLLDGSSIYFEANRYDGQDAQYIASDYGTALSGKICYYFYKDGAKTAYLPEALSDEVEFTLPHYTKAKESNRAIYTEPTVHEVDGKSIPMFTLTYPVQNRDGAFIGAVTVDLFLNDIYSQIQREEIFKTGYVVITNGENQLIYSPRFDDLGKNAGEAGIYTELPPEGQSSWGFYAKSIISGEDALVSLKVIGIPAFDSRFYVSVAAPTREIYEQGYRLLTLLIAFSIAAIAAIALLLYFLIHRVVAPVKGITENANKLANGDVEGMSGFDLGSRSIRRKDEIYVLNEAIGKMLTQISGMQQLRLESLELRLEKEKAEESARAKNDFLAKMSHEIRTPMNAVIGMTEMILRKDLPQDVYEDAHMIKEAGQNLLSIINDILDFSKIESGKLEICEGEYMLPSLINDLVHVIRVRLLEKPVQFALCVDPKLPAVLVGDEVRVRQIITNLLSNAVKYTNEGHILLDVKGVYEDGIVKLGVAVSDTGIGIKEEEAGKLFGDFVQIDTVKNRGVEGTGLGLAIARNLCRLMGGDITLQSEYGKGSTFTLELPQRYIEGSTFAPIGEGQNPSVLLYETRAVYRDSIVNALEALNVPYLCTEDIPTLLGRLADYDYVFLPSFAYGSIRPAMMKLGKAPAAVLLSDITETLSPKGVKVLALPAHSLSVFNILHDRDEERSTAVNGGASFIAPDAKVLVVDDIMANLKVAEGLLLPYEVQVTLCDNAAKAIALIEKGAFDLVFMDHMMPEMDGLEATRRIRGLDSEYFRTLPIIALTANAVVGVREMFIQNGMNDFLAKPIETAKLDAMLSKWIPKHKHAKNKAPEQPVQSDSPFVDILRSLRSLSVDKALSVVGGSAEAYERIFRLSVRLLPENIARLESLIEADLPGYAIEVHGIKSVLNNLGAYALGLKALKLEELSKNGDHESCLMLHPDFIGALRDFCDKVGELIDDGGTKQEQGDAARLQQAFEELKSAVGFYDGVLALDVLASIEGYTFGEETDAVLEELAHALERFDFDAAEEWLPKLERKVEDYGGHSI